ncbi:hypothetical protein ERC79_07715 [Rhodococcus sp. ABRD24]|uniref:Rv0361 family membrane protein n=1 Tax=Rhodococcus sp. ABRD24 TaxID=2507582 RepID=UPI00103FB76F|nr:hypothetical protein [Rhodococcus sp. ABRD24]QBJ95869.1 hypothetical protein ERC79_07715 [Rhodococcus sp. ABRD24]
MTDTQEPVEDPRRTTAKPFILAVSIVALVMIAIVLAAFLSPAEENLTESDRLNATVGDFARAHNNGDAIAMDRMVCQEFAEDRSPFAGRDGEITVSAVESAQVTGDRATAVVKVGAKDGKGDVTSTWNFTRGDDRWLVCN